MKLDSRIIEGKKPLDCFDVDIAKQFIGHEGYFCDHRSGFTNIYNLVKDVLRDITPDDNYCEVYKTNCTSWEYFLPEEWLKEPEEWLKELEKKYRPYTVMEFIKEYPLGSHLHFRPKDKLIEMHRLIDGYNDCLNGAGTLFICGAMYSMRELYDNYDIFRNGEWQPFGVVDDDVSEIVRDVEKAVDKAGEL